MTARLLLTHLSEEPFPVSGREKTQAAVKVSGIMGLRDIYLKNLYYHNLMP